MVEVEQVFERVGELIASGQVLVGAGFNVLVIVIGVCVVVAIVVSGAVRRVHEALLDESEERGVIADGVRDVVAPGEGRDGDEGNADSVLIEVGALGRVGAGGIGSEGGAERDGVVQAGVGVADEVGVAFGPAAGLQAGGRVRSVGALAGRDAVGIGLAGLASVGGADVIVGTAVLIVGDEDDGILPAGAVADGVDDLRDVGLAALDVGGRMLVVFEGNAAESEVGIDEGDLGKGSGRGLGQEELQRQEVR